MSIFILIATLFILVTAHEFGHFIVAKKSGMKVEEFGFGFPPKLFSFKKGETVYSFNAIPFGGFVKILGENPDEESEHGPDNARSFTARPKYLQAFVLFAGVAMNVLVAWLLLSVGFMAGVPSSLDHTPKGITLEHTSVVVTGILSASPAEKAGLKIGDTLVSFTSKKDSSVISNPNDAADFVRAHSKDEISISYIRKGENQEVKLTPQAGIVEEGKSGIGIGMDTIGTLKLPIHKAVWQGFTLTFSLIKSTFIGLFDLLHKAILGKATMQAVTGPVGLAGVAGDAYQFGFTYLLSFVALISINLAVINLMPFPALDGGRLLFLLIEKIKGSPIKASIANIVNMVGFFTLIGLMVFVTIHDVLKLLK